MPISETHKQNFETIRRAFTQGDVALVECQVAATGEEVPVICATNLHPDGGIEFVPFAAMFPGNPYEAINPPNPERGFYTQSEVWETK